MILLIFMGGILVTNSCLIPKVRGCMDRDSKNFNPNAQLDDGSCVYEGSIVFWCNQTTANALVNNGATALTFYVDGELVGSSAAGVYWTGAPNCGQSGSVTVKKDLGGFKIKSSTYSVRDQTGFERWGGTVNFTANTCITFQLY